MPFARLRLTHYTANTIARQQQTCMSFDTNLLDQLLAHRYTSLEQERQAVLAQVHQWLEDFGSSYGIHQAYLFGSMIRPGEFKETSDVDIAVEEMNPEAFFSAISFLSTATGREVDLIELRRCHFAHRIRQQGDLWTKDI